MVHLCMTVCTRSQGSLIPGLSSSFLSLADLFPWYPGTWAPSLRVQGARAHCLLKGNDENKSEISCLKNQPDIINTHNSA